VSNSSVPAGRGNAQASRSQARCAPRVRPRGSAGAVEAVHVLWGDLDTPLAVGLLGGFNPSPAMVALTAGTTDGFAHRHAFAARLAVSLTTVQRLAHAGELTKVTIGGSVRFEAGDGVLMERGKRHIGDVKRANRVVESRKIGRAGPT
jgi:excisionase family DNA binding protein